MPRTCSPWSTTLDLAKAESGRLDAVVDDVDVDGALRGAPRHDRAAPAAGRRPGGGPTGRPAPPENRPGAAASRPRNLLSNAAKFTAAGTVRLSAEADESGYRLTVADTGIGMSTADREAQIFDEFYQARTPLHATTKGTGLGLSFVQRVATALGATIEVSSELGAGSRFVVVLPSPEEASHDRIGRDRGPCRPRLRRHAGEAVRAVELAAARGLRGDRGRNWPPRR